MTSIPAAFAAIASVAADLPAVTGEAEALSYSQLATQADNIGRWLLARGIGPGATVGHYSNRSGQAVAAILGIL